MFETQMYLNEIMQQEVILRTLMWIPCHVQPTPNYNCTILGISIIMGQTYKGDAVH